MDRLHSLLRRQLQRHLGPAMSDVPPCLQAFIQDIDNAYRGFDADREMLERSLDLSSEELVQANSEVRAVFRAIPDLMLRVDHHGTILNAKEGAGDHAGLARVDLVGKLIQDTPLAPVAERFVTAIGQLPATGGSSRFEYRAGPSTHEADYEARLVLLPGGDALAMIRDISERKQAERDNLALVDAIRRLNAELEQRVIQRTEALRQQEALFHAAADEAPQAMWIANRKGAVTYLNRAWYELVGGESPKWHGHEWMEVVLPEDVDDMKRKWAAVKDSGNVFVGTRRVRCLDGTLHTLSYRASPVHDADGKISCWIGMDADVTELKAIEWALRLSNRELEAFSYSVSHDLRAPLATIDGFSKLLDEQLGSQDEVRLKHYLQRVRSSASRMSQLIDSLLSLAQIARNKLNPESVDLSQLAATTLSELHSSHPDRKVSVTIEPDLTVHGDPGLLSIALGNLLSNAWKFTSRRKDAQIRVGRHPDGGGETTIYVADNGAGFDMEYSDKLFGTFQRLHSHDEFPGTGVGLATVKRIVARHGGRVWADSRPGDGAVFFLSLPEMPPHSAFDSSLVS